MDTSDVILITDSSDDETNTAQKDTSNSRCSTPLAQQNKWHEDSSLCKADDVAQASERDLFQSMMKVS